MGNKKVSIVIPVFNNESTISECLTSVQNMSYRNKEIIIVFDNGTTDKSMEIIKKSMEKNNFKLVVTKKTTPGAARNIGLKNSAGEFVLFADADTVYPNDFLNKALRPFSDPKVGGVMGKKRVINENYNLYVKSKANDLKIRLDKNYRPISAWVFRSDVIKKLGGYSGKIYYFAEDVELAERLKTAGYKISYATQAVWYEIERSGILQDFRRYFRWGVSLSISKYPQGMRGFVLKIIVGSLYYSSILLSLPIFIYSVLMQYDALAIFLFYTPFLIILLRYLLMSVSKTGKFFPALLYKTTALLRGFGIFSGFVYGKLFPDNEYKTFMSAR